MSEKNCATCGSRDTMRDCQKCVGLDLWKATTTTKDVAAVTSKEGAYTAAIRVATSVSEAHQERKGCNNCNEFSTDPLEQPCRACIAIVDESFAYWRPIDWSANPESIIGDIQHEFADTLEVTAPGLLDEAARIMEERGKQYDQPGGERSMAKTIAAFNTITGHNLSEVDGWQFMEILKAVRLFSVRDKAHEDSVKDGIAYAALKGEAALRNGDLN